MSGVMQPIPLCRQRSQLGPCLLLQLLQSVACSQIAHRMIINQLSVKIGVPQSMLLPKSIRPSSLMLIGKQSSLHSMQLCMGPCQKALKAPCSCTRYAKRLS